MPQQIAVLSADQALDAVPALFVSLCKAKRMQRRGWADMITPTLYRRRTAKAHMPEEIILAWSYIPEKMPSREVPGCFWQMPQNDQWKIQHRTVTFMPREA